MSSTLRQRLDALGRRAPAAFMIVFADGSEYWNRAGAPAFILRFRSRSAERRALLFGHVGMLDAYFSGALDVDGDFNALFRIGMDSGYDRQPNPLIPLRNQWHEWRHSNTGGATPTGPSREPRPMPAFTTASARSSTACGSMIR